MEYAIIAIIAFAVAGVIFFYLGIDYRKSGWSKVRTAEEQAEKILTELIRTRKD